MTETSIDENQSNVLGLLAKSAEGRLKAGDIKKKLGKTIDATEADRALSELLNQGMIAVAGGPKEGHHPRPGASYRLTDQGKHHLRPLKPDFPEDLLEYQEAFILLQVFRAKEQKLTRSDLNGKLKTRAAVGQLEFEVKDAPGTVDYHLAALVEKGYLDVERRGNSVGYVLSPDRGAKALASLKQHDAVTFTMTGETLTALLQAARGSAPVEEQPRLINEPPASMPVARLESISVEEIASYVEQLRAGPYAGQDLIPIHEVRRLVAKHHGAGAASHATFDPLLKRMRSDGQLRLIAIADGRDATQEQQDDAIPGLNEILFYIVNR